MSGAPATWSVVPQMQLTLSALQHVRASVGVNIPVTERDANHVQIMAYVLWDTFDGPSDSVLAWMVSGCQH